MLYEQCAFWKWWADRDKKKKDAAIADGIQMDSHVTGDTLLSLNTNKYRFFCFSLCLRFFFPFATMHIIHTLPPLYQIIIHTFMPNTTDCKCSSQALSAFWYTNYISANGTCQLWSLSLLFACGRRQYGLMTRCTHSREIFFVVALLVESMLSFYIFLRANFLFFRMNSLFIYYRICFFRHMTFKCDVIIIYIHNDAIYERLYNTRILSRFT